MNTSFDTPKLNLEQQFHYDVCSRLAQLGKSSMLMALLIAGLVSVVFWNDVDRLLLAGWLAVMALSMLARALLLMSFWRMQVTQPRLRTWMRGYLFFLYVSAACWGSLPLLEVFQSEEWARSLLVFIGAGMSSGGVASLYPLLFAALPYILLIMLPMMIVLAQGPDPSLLMMAVMAGLYTVTLVRTVFLLNGTSNQAIRQDIENRELFRFLKKTRGAERAEIEGVTEWAI